MHRLRPSLHPSNLLFRNGASLRRKPDRGLCIMRRHRRRPGLLWSSMVLRPRGVHKAEWCADSQFSSAPVLRCLAAPQGLLLAGHSLDAQVATSGGDRIPPAPVVQVFQDAKV